MSKTRFTPTVRTTTLLERMGTRRSDAGFIAGKLAAADARFMILTDLKPVIHSSEDKKTGSLRWFSQADIAKLALPKSDALFLGLDRKTDAPHFALAFSDHRVRTAPDAITMLRPAVDLRSLAMQGVLPSEDLSLAGQARALAAWHDNARHCGHCGGTNQIKDGGWKRKCWACGMEHFPRTDPVVIMLVVDPARDRCLLGHEARFAEKMYSTLAGFIEAGEDIAHAVQREVFEEAGITVGEVTFHSTQPWPFPHSLMIGCIGIAETTEINIDPTEIQEARWFPRAEVKLMAEGKHPDGCWIPGQQAIARALITAFIDGSWQR